MTMAERIASIRPLNADDPAGHWFRAVVERDGRIEVVHVPPPAELVAEAVVEAWRTGRLQFNTDRWALELLEAPA